MDEDASDGFELHLEWANGPPAQRHPTPVHLEPPRIERPNGLEGDRMRLVLALGNSEVELRGAIDAIDARATDLQGSSVPVALAAQEEIREYIASGFDVIRELTTQLRTLSEHLLGPIPTFDRPTIMTAPSALAPPPVVETGRPPTEEVSGQSPPPSAPRFTQPSPQPLTQPSAQPWDESPAPGSDEPPAQQWDEPSAQPWDEASAQTSPEPSAQSSAQSSAEASAHGAAPLDEIASALDVFTEAIERVQDQQRQLLDEFARLTDELANYRRRVQVHARPPVVTDEQLETIVARVADTVTGRKPTAPRQAPLETDAESGETPAVEEPKLSRRERRRAASAAAEFPPTPAPAEEGAPVATEDATPDAAETSPAAEPTGDEEATPEGEPGPRLSRRERRKAAQRSSA